MRMVWCLSSMQHFGRIVSRALGWPLMLDGPVGDCEVVYIVGMYGAPTYSTTLAATARAKRRIIHWCGTDSRLLTRPDLLPSDAIHVASFDCYRDNVRVRGVVDCQTLYLPTLINPEPMPLPEAPAVGIYIGDGSPTYGSNIVSALAASMPDVKFRIVPKGALTADGMLRFITDTTVSVQAGNLAGGSTTREMMAAGRIALSTIPMPHARLISNENFPHLLASVREALAGVADPEQAAYWHEQNADKTFAGRVEALLS